MPDLRLELHADQPSYPAGEPVTLRGVYANAGAEPLALAFWWCRRLRVLDAAGREVPPGPGPVLPCGAAEELTVLEPGARLERDEPLGCTQPAGRPEPIGWSYELAPGRYRVALVFEAPPAHGFSQAAPDPRSFRGRAESPAIELVIGPAAPRRGLLGRLLGR